MSEDVTSLVTHVNDLEISTYAEKVTKEPNDCIIDEHDGPASRQSINLSDSGVDLRSLTKLIDDRVDEKLRSCSEPQCTASSEKEIVKTFFATRTESTDQTSPRTLRDNNEMREQNIIIHGINEGKHTDAQYVSKLFDILGLDHSGLSASCRLGMKQNERKRPLKLVMKSIVEKHKVMSRLGRLRGADEEFKKISVTDDYTVEERQEIKRWVMMASERNTNNTNDHVWKVRGTPKIGMRLALVKHQ